MGSFLSCLANKPAVKVDGDPANLRQIFSTLSSFSILGLCCCQYSILIDKDSVFFNI